MFKNFTTRIKQYVFKRACDKDLYIIFKLALSVPDSRFFRINLKAIRANKMKCRFDGLDEYLQSMDKMVNAIKLKKQLPNHFYSNMEERECYLDDWLITASTKPYSVYGKHQLIQNRIVSIIDAVYKHYDDGEYFNYYKRLNTIHFQQLNQWVNTIMGNRGGLKKYA